GVIARISIVVIQVLILRLINNLRLRRRTTHHKQQDRQYRHGKEFTIMNPHDHNASDKTPPLGEKKTNCGQQNQSPVATQCTVKPLYLNFSRTASAFSCDGGSTSSSSYVIPSRRHLSRPI